MSTTTTNYGLIKPDTTDPILVGQLNDNADVIDATLKSLSDALDVAKLGIKYKGEVNYYSNLPSSGNQIGNAYTVKYAGSSGTTPDGTEYVWGTVSGTNQWINFSKDSYTKAEVDALLSLKANIADIPTPSTAAPAMDGTAAAGTSTNYARADHVHPSDTSKQDALSAAQLAAANSGIDSAKVEQIETNKNDILLLGYADNIINTTFDWSDGFIWTNGSINASSQSQFSQPLLLHAGEKITVKTTNKNIGIICSTTADVVRVGDSVTVLQTTSNIAQEEAYSYTATADIRIVICVLKSNYDAYVSQKSSLPLCDWITLQIRSMQST